MDNLNFLEKLLKEKVDYWIVAKFNDSTRERMNDDILFISLPTNIKRGIDINELKLSEVKKIQETYVDTNIFFTGEYAPFQLGVRLDSFWTGFPVKNVKIKQFVLKCLELNSYDIYDYEKLLKNNQEQQVEKALEG